MKNEKLFNANVLKLIASVAMTFDHVGYLMLMRAEFATSWIVMRVFGRLTIPIMCFFIAEGYHWTRDWRKYALRLFLFALVSHFAYVFCFNFEDGWSFLPFAHGDWRYQTSIMWGLLCGLFLVRVFDTHWQWFWKCLACAVLLFLSLPADGDIVAPLAILFFWRFRDCLWKQLGCMLLLWTTRITIQILIFHQWQASLNFAVVLVIPFLWQYNGQRGRFPKLNQFLKWFFYWYYPLHLFVLGLIF